MNSEFLRRGAQPVYDAHALLIPRDLNGALSSSFPLSYIDGDQPMSVTGIDLIKRRAARLPAVRGYILEEYKRLFTDNPDVVTMTEIFNRVAVPIDRLFISSMELAAQGPVGKRSWREVDPEAVDFLQMTVNDIRVDFADYFRRNPEQQDILDLVAFTLAEHKNPALLRGLQFSLEQLAVTAAEKGQPVLLFCLSEFYTRPDANPEKPQMLEPDIRFILPVGRNDKAGLDTFVREFWSRLLRVYRSFGLNKNIYIPRSLPGYIYGIGAGFAGSQLWSYSSGEAHSSLGYHVLVNFMRDDGELAHAFRLRGDAVPDNLVEYLVLIYKAHEMGHLFNKHPQNEFDEPLTDMTLLVECMAMILEKNQDSPELIKHLNVRDFLTVVLGAYARYATDGIDSRNVINLSYAVTGRYVVSRLLEYFMKTEERDGEIFISVADESEVKQKFQAFRAALYRDLRGIVIDDMRVQTKLREIDNYFHNTEAYRMAMSFKNFVI